MGLMDKIKNLFSDEVEEVPVKKEVIQVEIPSPVKEEEKKEELISDNETLKKDEKFNFPVYFDDKDFDALDYKPKEEKKESKSSYLLKTPKKDEKKPFKPSPIISPVYGVLDKNYSKDDIKTKTHNKNEPYFQAHEVTFEDVRKKAYGTLEEDLQDVIIGTEVEEEKPVEKYEPVSENNLDIFEELENEEKKTVDDDLGINYSDLDMTIEEVDNGLTSEETKISDEEEIKKMFDDDENLTEGDLFNLIDSIKEDGDEDE